MIRFLAFDLEIATPIPDGATDWRPYRPFGISCAATFAQGEDVPHLWHGVNYAAKMEEDNVCQLIDYLQQMVYDDYTILTFNGAGFDFEVLAEESGMVAECKELAMNHIDIFFQLFCQLGYAPGLDRLCKGMNLGEKPEGINGAAAPQMWLDGRYQEVLDYCAGDVRLTMALALEVKRLGAVRWTGRAGKSTGAQMLELLTVQEAMLLPEPNISWMTGEVWTRDKFTGWMGK
jgi:hypothetical protein